MSKIESLVKKPDGWYLYVPGIADLIIIKNQQDAESLYKEHYAFHLPVQNHHYTVKVTYQIDCILGDWPVAILQVLHYEGAKALTGTSKKTK